ncbi:hypothetical protein TTHERM_00399350 (macronuclear) [Tetrahymena thermophila SB210]|uniref:Uncharacterized protein n=1 Tax=Tetrahymena thermophila (strain SB210) TaxID=312017 RepID=I7LUH1_TETTS|nr:hypothetical protein TTHERM_00399350 [Tetrahymena thermophila SB210]EAR93763.2 hypothetical protein TTHERM_00399350 [Tetrahymena thermophila SB210]|eukprot:XP_001014008.2 hypothetical protein TTHERM_00399350 [Tetrahymena thermophila SB210]
MNQYLEQALLDNESRQFLFKLEIKIIKYLSEIQKAEKGNEDGVQYFNLKSFQKKLIKTMTEYYNLNSKSIYVKVVVQNAQTEGDDQNSNKQKKKKKQGLLLFRSKENLNAPTPALQLRDYFTSSQLQIHNEIVNQRKQHKKNKKSEKKLANESENENENCSNSVGKDEDCSLSSASSNTGIHSKDESSNSSRQKIEVYEDNNATNDKKDNFLPSLNHILCLNQKQSHHQNNQDFDFENWASNLVQHKFLLRKQSETFSFIVFGDENEAQSFMQQANQEIQKSNIELQIIPLTKIDRKLFKDSLKNEYLDQTIQKPKGSVEVANRIIFGILGERKEIKNNSGDILKRLVNKD